MLKQSEHDIQTIIMSYLRLKGFKVWRCNSGRGFYEHKGVKRMVTYGERGMPDLMAISPKYGGRLVCIEVKSKTGKATQAQIDWLMNAEMHGAKTIVARDVKEVEQLLNSLKP